MISAFDRMGKALLKLRLYSNCLRDSRRLIGALLCLTAGGVVLAAEPSQPAPKQPRDMAKMWQTSLARQPLAATATFDAKGRLWLASVRDGHVLVSYSSDHGKTFSAPAIVNPEPEYVAADGENRPKILVSDNGNIYVSYTRSMEAPFSGNVRFSRSVDGGKTFSAPITVNDNLEPFTHRFEAMAVNKRGQIYIAWLDKRDASAANKKGEKYSGIALYYAVSDDEGKSFKANVKAADHTCECCRVAIAMDTDDYPVVIWRHIYDTNIRDHALIKLDGKTAPVRLSHENWNIAACPHHGPSLSIASDGTYHATWFNNAPERHGLFYAYSTDRGRTFSTPLNFGNFESQAAHPFVLALGKRIHLAWKEFDGENTGIFGMISRDGGESWSTPEKLVTTSDISDSPLLIGTNYSVYLSWNTKNEGFRLIEIDGGRENK